MFKAKVLLCGVPVLVLVMGWLLCQTRAVALQRERAEVAERTVKVERDKALQKARQAIGKAEELLRDEPDNVRQGGPNLEKALVQLAELRAKTHKSFQQQRQKMMERMKELEVQERETLAKIDGKANELQGELKKRPAGQAAPAADKFDRILERLDRIEQRLERLERTGNSSSQKKPKK